eukprot:TRINITY_DN16548_c1_g2_i1.p1 TRINITY_DN16548_c1_g2~~TRINITY_DN16548_c1_g2_i1.p1  ORF type:complete len:208 (-),score=49.48 TRINITY_DN16548_c1_g2_i1:146-769(-)
MPAGNVAAIVAVRRTQGKGGGGYRPTPLSYAEQKRREAAFREYQKRVEMNRIIRTYDTNRSGKLERDQVVNLLTAEDTSSPPGTPPTDDQVQFLLSQFDKTGDQSIGVDELEELLTCWSTFVEHRAEFEEKLKKYDVSRTGKLSKDEVRAYLKDLNGGMDVTDEEVDMVMEQADVCGDGQLNKMELQRATALWYGYVEKKSSCCCVL